MKGLISLHRFLCALPLVVGCAKTTAAPESPAATTTPEPGAAQGDAGGAAHDHAQHDHAQHDHAGHDHAGHDHAGHDHAQHDHAQHDHDGHAHQPHHAFDDAEAWSKKFDHPQREEWQRPEAVLDFIGLAPDARVADLGAGTGYFAVRFARRVPRGRVLANDVEPDMVRYLGERAQKEGLGNVISVQGKPDDPALPEAVDVAFMCNVYHHIADRKGYFGKLAAQLRPGGRLVVVDFEKDAPSDAPGPPPHMRVARDVLVAELAEAGFELVRADGDTLPYQYIVELRPVPKKKR